MAAFGPPTPLTREDLIQVLRTTMDPTWLEPLLADPTSSAIFEAAIAALLRAQEAGDVMLSECAFMLSAPGASRSLCSVPIQRPSGGALVTLDQETRFADERGATWRPVADVTFPAAGASQTIAVALQSDREGHWLDTYLAPSFIAVDALPDETMLVLPATAPAEGGLTDVLSLHGSERDSPRAPDESDDAYRARMATLVDQVSPRALALALVGALDAGASSRIIADRVVREGLRPLVEVTRDSDQDAQPGLAGEEQPFVDDAFVDDSWHVLRGPEDSRAWFDVEVPSSAVAGADLAALADELDRKRAAGVRFRIKLDGPQRIVNAPSELDQAGAWVAAGSAAPADLLASLAPYDGDGRYASTSTGAGTGGAADADDLVASFPPIPTLAASVTRVYLRARVRSAGPAGTDPALGWIWGADRIAGYGLPIAIAHADWREYVLQLDQNPATAAPWTPADLAAITAGVANQHASATTRELRVAGLVVEIRASY